MPDIIEKVKEKTKDVKDKVVENTKDLIDATKESFSPPSQSSSTISPNPTFTSSSSVTYVPNPDENNSDIDNKKLNSLLTERNDSEQKIFSTNMEEKDSIKNTNYDSSVIGNLQIDNQQHHQKYLYKENNEYFDLFTLSIKLWQNYYITWMNFYTGVLESFNRTITNI